MIVYVGYVRVVLFEYFACMQVASCSHMAYACMWLCLRVACMNVGLFVWLKLLAYLVHYSTRLMALARHRAPLALALSLALKRASVSPGRLIPCFFGSVS